jgi:hypothetical protein
MKKIKNLPKDPNKRAFEIVRLSTEEPEEPKVEETPIEDNRSEISKYLSTIGRKGGLKGGKARSEKLTPERRKEISKKAALTRWKKD